MSEQPVSSPSLAKILLATVAALIVAGILLVVAILPAEYGIDPLGTGKALGLGDLAKAPESKPTPEAKAPPPTATPEATISPVLGPPLTEKTAFGASGPHMAGAFIAQPKRYKTDSREMELGPGEGMEIKYNLKKGGGLIYSWTAEKPLLYEFHGDPDVRPPDKSRGYFESYEVDDKAGKREFHGTFVAPKSGIHGWFWQNTSSEPVKLKLVSAGFYDWIQESRNDKQRPIDPADPQ